MKRHLKLELKLYSRNYIFLIYILVFMIMLFNSVLECSTELTELDLEKTFCAFLCQILSDISLYIPPLLGILSAIHLGLEFTNKTFILRYCLCDYSKLIFLKLSLAIAVALVSLSLIVTLLTIYTADFNLYLMIGLCLPFLLYCIMYIMLALFICLLTKSELSGIMVIILLWVVENNLQISFTPLNVFLTGLNKTLQYNSSSKVISASSSINPYIYFILILLLLSMGIALLIIKNSKFGILKSN